MRAHPAKTPFVFWEILFRQTEPLFNIVKNQSKTNHPFTNLPMKNIFTATLLSFILLIGGCSANEIKDAQQLQVRPGLTHIDLLNSIVGCEKINWSNIKDNTGKVIVRMDCLLNPKVGIQADLMNVVSQQISQDAELKRSEERLKSTTNRWENTFGARGKVVISYFYKTDAKKPTLDDIRVLVSGNESSIGRDSALALFAVFGLQQPVDAAQQRLQWAGILITKAQPNPMDGSPLMSVPYRF